MTLIHTAELANTFDYLCELQRHTEELKEDPGQWMPWNYRETLQRIATEVHRLIRAITALVGLGLRDRFRFLLTGL